MGRRRSAGAAVRIFPAVRRVEKVQQDVRVLQLTRMKATDFPSPNTNWTPCIRRTNSCADICCRPSDRAALPRTRFRWARNRDRKHDETSADFQDRTVREACPELVNGATVRDRLRLRTRGTAGARFDLLFASGDHRVREVFPCAFWGGRR